MNKIQQQLPVSVLMPVYNGDKHLHEAIQSIINQTFTDFELVIIDDGSTDRSKEIILSFQDTRIRYVENVINIGLIKTLNKGIPLCQGKYIARMDADDIAPAKRLEKLFVFMEKHPEIGVCGTWGKTFDDQGRIIGKIINQTDPEFVSIHLLFSVPFPTPCIRRELLTKNPYHEVPVAEDYDLWCRLNDVMRMANIPEFLFLYRWHETNVSREKSDIQQQNKQQIICRELAKLNLNPDAETLRIHGLSFSLYGFNAGALHATPLPSDLIASEQWFVQLLSANRHVRRYNHSKFTAFLWARWIVLCLFFKQKRKIFFPSFANYSPKVLYYLGKQIGLLSKK